ncbi:hypothetical protein GCM10028862_21020 [Luteimonas pelagia]
MAGTRHHLFSRARSNVATVRDAPRDTLALAIRRACAASATALVLAAPSAALAQSCTQDADGTTYCDGQFPDGITYQAPAVDLVLGDNAPTSVTNVDGDGVFARSGGDVRIESDASIDAADEGIEIQVDGFAGSGTVVNTGDIQAGNGIRVFAGEDARVENDGDIAASAGTGGDAYGIFAVGRTGTSTGRNSGSIVVESGGNATGAALFGFDGTRFENDGSIDVSGIARGGPGVLVSIAGIKVRDRMAAEVSNTGTVTVSSIGTPVSGSILADNDAIVAEAGRNASIVNSGTATIVSNDAASGLRAVSDTGAAHVDNSGLVDVASARIARGIGVFSPFGSATVVNSGEVRATGDALLATAIEAFGGEATITLEAGSMVSATSALGSAQGVRVQARTGGATVSNAGGIEVTGHMEAHGVQVAAVGGVPVEIANQGSILAVSGQGNATGIAVDGDGSAEVAIENGGLVQARGNDEAVGIDIEDGGTVTIRNAGDILVEGGNRAVAVRLDAAGSTLENTGTIRSTASTGGGVAIQGGDGTDTVTNAGVIHGAVLGQGGDDAFDNAAGGTWTVVDLATDFGDGDDQLDNAAGALIHLVDGGIDMGAGSGNAFTNAGTLRVSGQSRIHMGGETTSSGNALPLSNDGRIDMADGMADDRLTVVGDLGGRGAIHLDVSVAAGTADGLYVDGSMAPDATQTVNATFHPSLLDAWRSGARVPFAWITGDSTADSFVGGQVIGLGAGNFIDLGVRVTSDIDASNATEDVFYVGVRGTGLDAGGSLAASIGSGAWRLLDSTIGTWRQRMGVVGEPSSDRALSPFLRVFDDEGDITQAHRSSEAAAGGTFRFNQRNTGAEVGLDFAPAQGMHLGLLAGKVRGDQSLVGDHAGSDRIDGRTLGVYGTWVGQSGAYVDASYRAMRFDATLDAEGVRHRTRGKAGAVNVEAGWAIPVGGTGMHVEPQIQSTWARVDGLDVPGAEFDFRSQDATFRRARLGLGLWKDVAAGSITWTPYGAASVVRIDDADVGYAVADLLAGSTSIDGTGALVELGLGMATGGLSATLGANWSDGGALDDFLGGQLVMRYRW